MFLVPKFHFVPFYCFFAFKCCCFVCLCAHSLVIRICIKISFCPRMTLGCSLICSLVLLLFRSFCLVNIMLFHFSQFFCYSFILRSLFMGYDSRLFLKELRLWGEEAVQSWNKWLLIVQWRKKVEKGLIVLTYRTENVK